jgi:hypothetical protein
VNINSLLDVALLATTLLCACDALRQIHPRQQPLRALAFALVAIGALGWIDMLIRGGRASWFALALHGGFAIYSVIRLQARSAAQAYRSRTLRRSTWP